MEEFAIAKEQGKYFIPIGATGHTSLRIWEEVTSHLDRCYPNLDVRASFELLGNPKASNEEIIKAIFDIISLVTRPVMA